MAFDGNLNDLQYDCTFSVDDQAYAVCPDDDGEYFCVRIFFHPLDGYQYQWGGTTDHALRIATQIVTLARRFPEKYRLIGEHYDVTVFSEGERLRFRIYRKKALASRAKTLFIPLFSRFILISLLSIFILWAFGDTTCNWLSVLFPSLNYETLRTLFPIIQIITAFVFFIGLFPHSYWFTMASAFAPVFIISMLGFFVLKKLLWLLFLILCAILLIGFVIFFSQKKARLRQVFYFCGVVLFCLSSIFTLTITIIGIEPHTYESGVVIPADTSHEVLEEQYAKACVQLKEPTFTAREPQEKLDILQTVCNYECIVILGCDSPRVCAEWLEEEYIAGEYRSKDEIIVIDMSCLNDYDTKNLLSLLLHELRHHYQHRVTELYNILAPHLTEKNQNIDYLEEAKNFQLNYLDYKEYEKDGKEAYRDQYIEKDSRHYADKRMAEYYYAMLEQES